MPQTEKQRVGKIGEDIACKYLAKQGFTIVERNYWKKFGEIDIVAQKEGILHFIEVKSVSRRISGGSVTPVFAKPARPAGGASSGKRVTDNYRPEDNLHPWKLRRLGRALQVYLEDRRVSHETEWQVDAMTVLIDHGKRVGRVEVIENIVI